ncbi:MAG: 30S ribosomal protein S6 [Phycisphaerales bacterium]
MSDTQMNPYEGLFLFPQSASSKLADAAQHIVDILERAEADLVALQKWDERNLAYSIKKQKRGVFLLAYFKARGTKLANIERDCNLSEDIMRYIITRCDHMTAEEMEAADDRDSLRVEANLRDESDSATDTADESMAEPVAAGASDSSGDGDE